MQKKLPDSVDFLKQVERSACFEGAWPVSEFSRLAEVIYSDQGEVTARLKFSTRAGTSCLDGHVQAELELRCERCLEPVKQHIESGFRFGLITSEDEADSLPKEFEPLLAPDYELSLLELVEDEILLSLPIVARHDEECSEILQKHKDDDRVQTDTYRPFAALKDLMS
jgi:uncharacterized protein